MSTVLHATALHFLVLTVAGWLSRRQLAAIAYLREENRVLRADSILCLLCDRGEDAPDSRGWDRAAPYGHWMMQVGRGLLDAVDGFLLGKRYLILDRDPVYTAQFRRLLRDSGVVPLRLPAKSPNLNAYAARFVRSIRNECLDHIVLLARDT